MRRMDRAKSCTRWVWEWRGEWRLGRRGAIALRSALQGALVILLTLALASLEMTPVVAAEPAQTAPGASIPLEPAAALASFEYPRDLELSLVAAEPLIVDPVAIAFDERGRMFVAEYRDYPLGPPAGEPPLSRIKLLEDVDGDGRMDRATTYVERIPFAQGVLAYRDGAIVTAAPDVWWFADRDGDGVAEEKTLLFTGFKPGNPQLRVSHPRFALDNYVYFSNGLSGGEIVRPGRPPLKLERLDFRFPALDPDRYELSSGYGQFGNTFDDFGQRFFCSNRNPVVTALLPYALVQERPAAGVTQTFEDVAPFGGEAKVYPLVAGATTAASHAGTHTAACGVWIHRGDRLGPEYDGNVFVCEPTGSLVTRSRLEPHGVSYRATRTQAKQEFLAARDPWFRPVSLADGPDGGLYVVDMYREVIEHPQYMPPGLADTLRLRAGDDRGRIYRLAKKGSKPPKFTTPATIAERIALLQNPIGWRRDLGQRLLVEAQDAAAIEPLQALLSAGKSALADVHAMYTLQALGGLTSAALLPCFQRPAAEVREHAVRLADLDQEPQRAAVIALARDPAPRVRFAVALRLAAREEDLSAPLAEIAARDVNDPWIARAVTLTSDAAGVLNRLLADPAFTQQGSPERIELITQLAAVVGAVQDPARVKAVLTTIADGGRPGRWWRAATLGGLASGAARSSRPLAARSLVKLLADPAYQEIAPAARDFIAAASPIALDAKEPQEERLAALRLVAFDSVEALIATARLLLVAQESPEIQAAVIAALKRANQEAATRILIDQYAGIAPTVRLAALELLLSRTSLAKETLAAMQSGKLSSSAVMAEQRERLLKSPDAEIKAAAVKLFGQASANRQEVLAKYGAALTLEGDVARGLAVFTKTCAACHRVGDVGQMIGPDISDVRQKTPETLLVDILDPNRAVDPRFTNYTATTLDGRVLTGILATNTGATIVLVRGAGLQDQVSRSELESLEASGKSLMPEGIERDLTPQQVADVIAFLRKQR